MPERAAAAAAAAAAVSAPSDCFEDAPQARRRCDVEAATREQHALLGSLTFAQRQMEDTRSALLEQLRRATRESLPPSSRVAEQLERVDAELAAGDRSINAVTKRLEELALASAELEKDAELLRYRPVGGGDGLGRVAVPLRDSGKAPAESFYQSRAALPPSNYASNYVRGLLEGARSGGQQPLPFDSYRDQPPTSYSSSPPPCTSDSTYFETDLDSMVTRDVALSAPTPAQLADSRGSHLPAAGEWDIGEADDSTKRFFGILPKEKARNATTVRDVKRAAALRLEQHRDGGSCVDEVLPGSYVATQHGPASGSAALTSVQGRGAGESVEARHLAPSHVPSAAAAAVAVARAYLGNGSGAVGAAPLRSSGGGGSPPGGHPATATAAATLLPAAAAPSAFRIPHAGFRRLANGRVRYLTISSSQPLSFEAATLGGGASAQAPADEHGRHAALATNAATGLDVRSAAGGRGPLVTSIDLELSAPQKVFIPERYVPDADDAAEPTDEEKRAREQKSERLRKMLSAQSLQEWTRAEISPGHGPTTDGESVVTVGNRLVVEKKRREDVLEMRHMLAQEVSLKTREVAAGALKLRCRSQECLQHSVNSDAAGS